VGVQVLGHSITPRIAKRDLELAIVAQLESISRSCHPVLSQTMIFLRRVALLRRDSFVFDRVPA
jgi:hypothetical protein